MTTPYAWYAVLAVFLLLALAGFGFVVRWERNRYARIGQLAGWRRVRWTTLPVAVASALVVVLPARAVTGMEGLAVAYGLLFTLVPLLWFGTHWLAGRTARPPLSFKESAAIAASPLLYALVAAYVAHALQTPAWMLLRSLGLA